MPSKSYQKRNRLQLNEYVRQWKLKNKLTHANPNRKYNWYQDFIKQILHLDHQQLFYRYIIAILDDLPLTTRQRQMLDLALSGNNQREIAEQLGVVQSTVNKTLNGKFDYNYKRYQGGIGALFCRQAYQDDKLNQIIGQLPEEHVMRYIWQDFQQHAVEIWILGLTKHELTQYCFELLSKLSDKKEEK